MNQDWTKDIEDGFDTYEGLQTTHLHMLETQKMPDITLMTRERKKASEHLQRQLNAFIDKAGNGSRQKKLNSLTRYETRLGTILRLDETLAGEIKKHRDRLKINLIQLKHGKTAIQGYRPAGGKQDSPRVLSISR